MRGCAIEQPGEIKWDIRREGHIWQAGEGLARFAVLPYTFEVIAGELLWSDEERMAMLATMLEVVGVDRAVRLGDPQVWREAVAALG